MLSKLKRFIIIISAGPGAILLEIRARTKKASERMEID
jgi:hypothetical protein